MSNASLNPDVDAPEKEPEKEAEACLGACQQEEPYGASEASDPVRRTFVWGFFGLFAAIWAAGAAYPLFRYILPKQEEAVLITELNVCSLDELPPGTGKNFMFGSIPAIVIRDEKNNLSAFNAKCSHLGCTVQYKPDISNIYCACHGGVYDAQTGKNIAGPPPAPLATLKAEIVDNQVVVSRV